MKYILSFDAETDGLQGEVIAIGAVLVTTTADYDRDKVEKVAEFYGILADLSTVQNDWVRQNVLPKLQKETTAQRFETRESLILAFTEFYKEAVVQAGKSLETVTFCQYPVETNLFRKMYEIGGLGEFDHPCPLIDLSTLLHCHKATWETTGKPTVFGEIKDATSIEKAYNAVDKGDAQKGYKPTQAHNPLYDAESQLIVYIGVMGAMVLSQAYFAAVVKNMQYIQNMVKLKC